MPAQEFLSDIAISSTEWFEVADLQSLRWDFGLRFSK